MTSGISARGRLARLDDYVSGHMDDAEAERFEETLFAEAAAHPDRDEDLLFLDRVSRFGHYLDSRNCFHIGATRSEVQALLATGRRIAYVDLGRGDVPSIRYSRSAEQLIMRLEVGLEGLDSVDVEIHVPGHGHSKTMRDVHYDAHDGELYACCEMPLAVMAAEVNAIWRIVGIEKGRRRTLAELSMPTELLD